MELPCPGPKEVGERLEPEDSLGSWPGGDASLCPLLLSPLVMALFVSACFLTQPPSLTDEARVTETPKPGGGMGNSPRASSVLVFDLSANLRIPPE